MKNLSIPIATVALALLLSGCGSDNDNGGSGGSSSAGSNFVATVRDTLTQPADAEPAAVEATANSPEDSAEPETL